MSTTPLFELRGVSKSYQNGPPTVEQFSLSLQPGEIFGLLGESGAGKSTLLQLAANLINADEGEVWLEGEKLPLPSDLLIPGHTDIKIVHQDYQLSPVLSVRENIRYVLRYYEKSYRDARIEELLDLCQLQEVAEQPAKLLSGGEKQRTAIARVLAEDARVLLLDEPFANLDLPNNRRLLETIRQAIAQSGAACIFVTHHASDALGLAHRLGILRNGRLLQVGTPQEIYQHPVDAYVAQICGEVNLLSAEWIRQHLKKRKGHVLNDGRIMIRPEQFNILPQANSAALEARVVWSVFEGSRYRLGVKVDEVVLQVYSREPIQIGQVVFLKHPEFLRKT